MCDNMEIDIVQELGAQPVKRPEGVEQDVSSLSQKKRVSNILSSPYFKEELEQAVTDVICSNKGGGKSIAKEIANFFSPYHPTGMQVLEAYGEMRGIQGLKAGVGCVSPINDLTGSEAISMYSKTERLLRCKLSTLYRIVDLFGWTHTINDHISVRLNKEQEHFLVNPYGLLYHEVSAAKLLKVNMQGDILDQGSTTLDLNSTQFSLHSTIHAARPDLHCVIHVQTPEVLAVSCMECGILPLCQEALMIGDISVHPFNGFMANSKERKALQKNLGPTNKVILLRNRGIVACGETIEEAFLHLSNTVIACSAQVKAMSCVRAEKLVQLDRSDFKSTFADEATRHHYVTSSGDGENGSIKWKTGEMEFEALVRMLDNMGYRSGYTYRNPDMVKSKSKVNNEMAEPPTVSSPPFSCEDLENGRGGLRRTEHQSRWVNSPNMYMKVEDDKNSPASSMNGDHSPKAARTKWLRSSSPGASVSASVRTNPNQFVPTGTDPREVAATRNSIRGQAHKHRNPPGPQSQILHSVAPKTSSSTSEVSSASKGIIERGVEVSIVTPAGPPNPFAKVSKEELENYKRNLLKASSTTSTTSGELKQTEEESTMTTTIVVESSRSEETVKSEHIQIVKSPVVNGEAAPTDDTLQNGHDKEGGGGKCEENNKSARASFEAAMSTGEVQRLVALEGTAAASTSSNERVSEEDGLSPRKTDTPHQATPNSGSSKPSKPKKKKRPLSFLKKKKQK